MSEETTNNSEKDVKKVKSTTKVNKLILNSPTFEALAETQKSLYTLLNFSAFSDAVKSASVLNSTISDVVKSVSVLNSPAISETLRLYNSSAFSDAVKSASVLNSTISDVVKSVSVLNSPAISEMLRLYKSPTFKVLAETQQNLPLLQNSSAFSDAVKSASVLNSSISDVVKSVSFLNSSAISNVLSNRLIFDNWVKTNTQLFESVNKRILFARQLDTNILPVLSNYNWFITVSLEDTFIQKLSQVIESSSDKTAIILRHEFINYFSMDNFKNLKIMVEGWQDNSLFKPRLKIFLDCVSVLRNSNNKCNPSNLLIPTLIAQIDGILTDYLVNNQFRITKQKRRMVWEDLNSNIISGRKKVYENIFEPTFLDYSLINNSMSTVAIGIGSDFILNTLFQTAYPLQKLKKPFGLSRHKIMHGENIKYGRKEHLFRTFLILDYLYGLENVDYN